MRSLTLTCLALLLTSCGPAGDEATAEPERPHIEVDDMVLALPEGERAHATFHSAATQTPVASLLLLHQARGDARGEYGPVVEEFARAGFDLLMLDMRSGGDLFGGDNRTAAKYDQQAVGYCDAMAEIDVAIDWLAARDAPVFVVGSSYSAALAVRAADLRADDVAGFVAFSPASGDPMQGCDPSEHMGAAPRGFVLRPRSEMEIERVAAQLDAFAAAGARTMVVEGGVHGASMMVDERTEADMAPIRKAVIDFVKSRAGR